MLYRLPPSQVPDIAPTSVATFLGGVDRDKPRMFTITIAPLGVFITDGVRGGVYDRKEFMRTLIETFFAVERKALANVYPFMEWWVPGQDLIYTDIQVYECLHAVTRAYEYYHRARGQAYAALFDQMMRCAEDNDDEGSEYADWLTMLDAVSRNAERDDAYAHALSTMLEATSLYGWNENNMAVVFGKLREDVPLLLRDYQ